MSAGRVFSGVGVALVTLFTEDGAVDVAATAQHAVRVTEAGVAAVLVAGSTGEAPTLDAAERTALITAVKAAVGDATPVIAGTGAPWTARAVRFTEHARDAGADAVLVLSPHRVTDPRPYYEMVAGAAGEVPVLAYHYPTMSAPGIPVSTLGDLPVVGTKDSSGDADRLLATTSSYEGDVYVGSSALLLQAGGLGCPGAILAAANLEPELCVAALNGDGEAQRRLADAHAAVKSDFPHGVKSAMARRYGTSTVGRMG